MITKNILQPQIFHNGMQCIHSHRTIILFLFTLFSQTGFTQPKDTLYFINDSKVIGELNKITFGCLEFDGDDMGIIKIKNNKISAIIAQSHYYRVETADRMQHQGICCEDLNQEALPYAVQVGMFA